MINVLRDSDCTRATPVIHGRAAEPVYGRGVKIRPLYPGKQETNNDLKIYLPELLPLEDYDLVIVLFSGGKDSMAMYFKLLELGVPKEKIELWHHDIDGKNPDRRMDWPVTIPYIKAFAEAENVPLRLSWRLNGFFGEVYRIGASYPIQYEDNGEIQTCRLSPKQLESDRLREQVLKEIAPEDELKRYGYRMKFPAKSADLNQRWCSAYCKIMVSDAVIRNLHTQKWSMRKPLSKPVQEAFETLQDMGNRGRLPAKQSCNKGRWCTSDLKAKVENAVTTNLARLQLPIRVLVVSGERRGESANRATYNEMEIHRTNATVIGNRLVHLWRMVIDHSERDVWEINRRHQATPHPCYTCGWNRCSCMLCVFSKKEQWAGIRELFPNDYAALLEDEKRLGFTLNVRQSLEDYVGTAASCVNRNNPRSLHQLVTGEFPIEDVYTQNWAFPSGAFHGAEGGPC